MTYIIITSINGITEAVRKFADISDCHVVVVGDRNTMKYEHPNVTYLDVSDQVELPFASTYTTPYNHYSRKNLGYLYAINKGADLIYDTDDDTIPYTDWSTREFTCSNLVGGTKVINPFAMFTDQIIWPRGLPLSNINDYTDKYVFENVPSFIGVWQGLIDGDSDFDAIYRLTSNEKVVFDKMDDIAIDKHSYAPFNTQSTLWNPEMSVLMYIPISVDFRFTDILRGYVAQRVMWSYGFKIGFHCPNTFQVRNEHDYFKDFLGELSMYQNVPKVIDLLNSMELAGHKLDDDLLSVYIRLVELGVCGQAELQNLQNWINDINRCKKK